MRTVIDLAASLSRSQLDDVTRDFLRRRLFTRNDLRDRLAQPDMATRPGTRILRDLLRL